jgi:mRNA interferase RelE/StbE
MKIFITKKAQKELDKIPNSLAKHIATKILLLPQNPHSNNSKKLKGQNNFRLRVGSFRIIYTTNKKEITILRIADRKTIYR